MNTLQLIRSFTYTIILDCKKFGFKRTTQGITQRHLLQIKEQ